MSRPLSHAAILEAAEAAEVEAAKLELQALALREHARLLREAAAKAPLTGMHPIGTMGTDNMEALSPSAGANISAAKTKSRWPLQRALIKRNLSLPEWARAQRKPILEVETAKSWLKKKAKGGRKVPRFWADRIAAEFVDEKGRTEVPAVDASYPSGIRED